MSKRLTVDSKLIIQFLKMAINEQEKLYGPVFSRMISRYATEFVAKKTNDKNPPSAETLDQSINYIMAHDREYPYGFCALAYGVAKTEKMLQGGIGPGARITAKEAMKRVAERVGTAALYGKIPSTTEAWEKMLDFAAKTHIQVGIAKFTGDADSVSAEFEECLYSDACKTMVEEGILALSGKIDCIVGKTDSITIEVITNSMHDYELIGFHPPRCILRIFKT
jgi:hypothetical protein